MRQVVEPRTNGDAKAPEDPVERRTNGVAAEMGWWTDERQVGDRTERDAPIADLVPQHPEVRRNPSNSDEERQPEDRGIGKKAQGASIRGRIDILLQRCYLVEPR